MSAVATTSVCKRDVPIYLQAGEFYRSLDDDQPGELFSVPADTLKPTLEITSTSDLVHALTSLRFWSVSAPQIEIFDFIIDNGLDEQIAPFEADFPYLAFLRAVKDNTLEDVISLLDFALTGGHFEVVPFLHEVYGQSFGSSSVVWAAESGNLDCLKYAHEHGCVITEEAFAACIYNNDIPCLEYVHLHCKVDCVPDTACNIAAGTNQFENLQFLHAHGYPCTVDTYDRAAEYGFLRCVQFLHENGIPWDELTGRAAARTGRLSVLTYLVMHGCPCDYYTMEVAVHSGSVPCVALLHEHGQPWDESMCATAALIGNLSLLMYLHEHGCPWDVRTCNDAIKHNKLHCLEYAHAQGAVWDESMFEMVQRGSEEMKEFMRNNICEGVKPFVLYEQEQQAREGRP